MIIADELRKNKEKKEEIEKYCSARSLKIGDRDFDWTFRYTGIHLEDVLAALICNTRVKSLTVEVHYDHQATVLSEILTKNKTIGELRLHNNYHLKDNTFLTLMKSLGQNLILRRLILSFINFKKQSIKTFSESLSKCINLERLVLSNCNLGSPETSKLGAKGSKFIIDALHNHPKLTFLDLSFNKIGSGGAEHVANFLGENRLLRRLRLVCCELGNEGAKYIGKALVVNSTLTELDIEGNSFKTKALKYFESVFLKNSSLNELELCVDALSYDAFKSSMLCLKANRSIVKLHFQFGYSSRLDENKAKEEMNQILDKNYERNFKTSFLMGFHHRSGKNSALYKASKDQIFEPKLIGLLFQFSGCSRKAALQKMEIEREMEIRDLDIDNGKGVTV